jgi:hypothetical protein
MADLAEVGRATLARNRFMVLGTVDPSGRPRVSPVWFSLVDHRDAFWLSSPDAHHSRNVGLRPEVSIVVFDSSADPYTGQAVYLEATASRVPDDELAEACASAFRDVDPAFSYTPESLADEPFCALPGARHGLGDPRARTRLRRRDRLGPTRAGPALRGEVASGAGAPAPDVRAFQGRRHGRPGEALSSRPAAR